MLIKKGQSISLENPVRVKNNGPGIAKNVTVQFTIPDSLEVVSVNETIGQYNTEDKIWTIGNLMSNTENNTADIDFVFNILNDCELPINIEYTVLTESTEANLANNKSLQIVDGISCCEVVSCVQDYIQENYYNKTEIDQKFEDNETNQGDPVPGKSAYEIAVENGFKGTEQEWLDSLKGTDGVCPECEPSQQGLKGEDGDSAYQVAVNNGFNGSEAEWLQSLEGTQGPKGDQGLKGEDGSDGLKGDKGDKGDPGKDGLNFSGAYFAVENIDNAVSYESDNSISMSPKMNIKSLGFNIVGNSEFSPTSSCTCTIDLLARSNSSSNGTTVDLTDNLGNILLSATVSSTSSPERFLFNLDSTRTYRLVRNGSLLPSQIRLVIIKVN